MRIISMKLLMHAIAMIITMHQIIKAKPHQLISGIGIIIDFGASTENKLPLDDIYLIRKLNTSRVLSYLYTF